MSEISATFRVTTPMFLGEAIEWEKERPGTANSIRPPSVKSAIRFWWRALQWKTYLARYPDDEAAALCALHAREGELFGSPAREENGEQLGGQGRFLLTVSSSSEGAPTLVSPPSSGQQYLLGMGLYSHNDGLLRTTTKVGTFTVRLRFRRTASGEERHDVAQALLLWGLLGGLGARSRKGYGSVAIQELVGADGLSVPQNKEEFENVLRTLLDGVSAALPPFTAFSPQSRIDVSLTGNSTLDLLGKVGQKMMVFRSYGNKGLVPNNPHKPDEAERNFGPGGKKLIHNDHDLAQAAAGGTPVTTHPARVVFGLPHNYRFGGTKDKLEINAGGRQRDRRASPLFIHIHTFPGGGSAAIQALLPAQFLPAVDQLQFKSIPNGGGRRTFNVAHNVDWQIIRLYLDCYDDRKALFP